MTMTPQEITTYQRQSNTAAGYCAACTVKLHPFETHVCDNCAGEFCIECDPNHRMEENDGEPTQGSPRP